MLQGGQGLTAAELAELRQRLPGLSGEPSAEMLALRGRGAGAGGKGQGQGRGRGRGQFTGAAGTARGTARGRGRVSSGASGEHWQGQGQGLFEQHLDKRAALLRSERGMKASSSIADTKAGTGTGTGTGTDSGADAVTANDAGAGAGAGADADGEMSAEEREETRRGRLRDTLSRMRAQLSKTKGKTQGKTQGRTKGRTGSRQSRQSRGGPDDHQQEQEQEQEQEQGRRRLSASARVQQVSLNPSDLIADSHFARTGSIGPTDWGAGEGFAAYSSAQFLVSRAAIRSVPRALWLEMLLAINGSKPLAGCALSTTDRPDGGHQLTGQYERMWHVLFGQPRRQPLRSVDGNLPRHLRIDCKPHGAGLCQQELEDVGAGRGDPWQWQGSEMRQRRKRRRRKDVAEKEDGGGEKKNAPATATTDGDGQRRRNPLRRRGD